MILEVIKFIFIIERQMNLLMDKFVFNLKLE
jgi:hypothetical protein